MNKKIVKILTVFILLLMFTGCTKTLKNSENKIVTYDSKVICSSCTNVCSSNIKKYNELVAKATLTEKENQTKIALEKSNKTCESDCVKTCALAKENQTGQVLTSNILCKPTNGDVISIYIANGVNIAKLPSCSNYKINEGSYEGLWTSFFVKPLAWLLLKIGSIFNNYGVALIILGILIRVLMMPLTKSTALQSENIKKAQPEISAIESKYKGSTDQDSVMKKSQETMVIYKKYGINPLSSCLFAVLQIPILFAFIEAINRVPAIFEGSIFGLKLGMTPLVGFSRGEWWYIIIVILLAVVTYYSFAINKATTPATNQKQMEIMNKVLIVFIIIMSFSLSTAIGIYWITSSAFTIFQNILVKRIGGKK